MKRFWPVGAGVAMMMAALAVAGTVRLNVAPRRQWDNNRGYCGECGIQQVALYYGTYISQARVRELIDETLQRDVRIPDNSKRVFRALRLATTNWNPKASMPQYQAYLEWVKGHLMQGHPVLVDMYMRGGANPHYDHVVVATGFDSAKHGASYNPDDVLLFNDNFRGDPVARPFWSLDDDRDMTGNGAVHDYCIPRFKNFGTAVTGVRDEMGTLRPVRVILDRWDEPNVSQGEAPVLLNARIRMEKLKPGRSYTLLRYNHLDSVPVNHYLGYPYSRLWIFKATRTVQVVRDQFMSDGEAVYRCFPTILKE